MSSDIGFLNLPRELQLKILSLLEEEVIQTVPFVCTHFKALSEAHELWNTQLYGRAIDREGFKATTLMKVQYVNEIAIPHLIPSERVDPFLALMTRPFEQRWLLLEFLSTKLATVTSIPKEQLVEMKEAICSPDAFRDAPFHSSFVHQPLALQSKEDETGIKRIHVILQALFCSDKVLEQLKCPLVAPQEPIAPVLPNKELGDEEMSLPESQELDDHLEERTQFVVDWAKYKKSFVMQQEVLPFIQEANDHDGTLNRASCISALLKYPSTVRLLNVIKKFDGMVLKYAEMNNDPLLLISLFFAYLFPGYALKVKECSKTTVLPGVMFRSDPKVLGDLQLGEPNGRVEISLIDAIDHEFRERLIQRPKTFDPRKGIPIDPSQTVLTPEHKINSDEYSEWMRLVELPPLFMLHIPRAVDRAHASLRLSLPGDGTIDLSRYYDAPKDCPLQPIYKIKSYIYGESGKEWAVNFEIKGKYYRYRTEDGSCLEISREIFLDRKDTHIIIVENCRERQSFTTTNLKPKPFTENL